MRSVVIGGSGFIGTHLVRSLLEQGHEVTVIDRNPSEAFPDLSVQVDIRDRTALIDQVGRADVLYHLAAEHRDDVRPPALYHDVNVTGTANVVEAAEANGIRRIVFTSTAAVYGLHANRPTEDSPLEPFNAYARSKLEAERVLQRWAEEHEIRSLVIVRPAVVFGEGNGGNVYTLIREIDRDRFVMVGTGENRKSMCYVENLALFLRYVGVDLNENLIVNYSDKPDLSMEELVMTVRTELGRANGAIPRVPYWLGLLGGYAFDALAVLTGRKFTVSRVRVKKFCADTRLSSNVLDRMDFHPPYSLRHGLRGMIKSLDTSDTATYEMAVSSTAD